MRSQSMLNYSTVACSTAVAVAVQGKTRFVVESVLTKSLSIFFSYTFDPVWSDMVHLFCLQNLL